MLHCDARAQGCVADAEQLQAVVGAHQHHARPRAALRSHSRHIGAVPIRVGQAQLPRVVNVPTPAQGLCHLVHGAGDLHQAIDHWGDVGQGCAVGPLPAVAAIHAQQQLRAHGAASVELRCGRVEYGQQGSLRVAQANAAAWGAVAGPLRLQALGARDAPLHCLLLARHLAHAILPAVLALALIQRQPSSARAPPLQPPGLCLAVLGSSAPVKGVHAAEDLAHWLPKGALCGAHSLC